MANSDARYRPLVRIGKAWRNHAELVDELGSFPIELILAHLNVTQGAPTSLEAGLQRLLLYIAQTQLQDPITSGNRGATLPRDAVIILDPVNAQNNVAARMSDLDRQTVVAAATVAWETLMTAHHNSYKGETFALWREVFGSSFTVEAEEAAA
jgi:hypothetical protein